MQADAISELVIDYGPCDASIDQTAIVAADEHGEIGFRIERGRLADIVDDPARRVSAVKGALRSAKHFNIEPLSVTT